MRTAIYGPLSMRKIAAIIAAAGIFAILFMAWRSDRAREAAEMQLGLDSSRVISVSFEKAREVKVYSGKSVITARTTDPAFFKILSTSQTKKIPVTFDYFINLKKVDQSDYRWNKDTQTLIVTMPDITIGSPNANEEAAEIEQVGLYISREAGIRMNRNAARAVRLRAMEEARKPENILAARESARTFMTEFTRAPLKAAGLSNVKIAVRFPFDSKNANDRWDESRPVADIMREYKSE